MYHYEEMARFEKEGLLIVVDCRPEDVSPYDLFDDTVDDIAEICRRIDSEFYSWFLLRVRCFLSCHELSVNYLGGCLYEKPLEVMVDGTASDMIDQALIDARHEIDRMHRLTGNYLSSMAKEMTGEMA